MCRRPIIKICENIEKVKEIQSRTPLNDYKQRGIEHDARQKRQDSVKLHRYTEQITTYDCA